jgi:hypothetical protein
MNTQLAFRQVNDSIREVAPADTELDVFDFFCECEDAECHERVRLTLQEFDARRAASPPAPILGGHEESPQTLAG